MEQFDIYLKNGKVKLYNRITWFIIAILTVLVIYFSIASPVRKIQGAAIIILGFIAICSFLWYYFRNSKWQFNYHPFFYLLMLGFIFMGKYRLAAIPLIFDLLSISATRKLIVIYSAEKIFYPSFPYRNIKWDELNNTVLKDGLLTIDLKNNKLIQQFIDETKTTVNQEEFNDFCKKQLQVK